MKLANIETIIEELIAATNQYDIDTALTLFAENASIDDVSVGKIFKNIEGVNQYLQDYFVAYHTQSKIESIQTINVQKAIVQLDFTGDFGHETGALNIALNKNGLIQSIKAHLD